MIDIVIYCIVSSYTQIAFDKYIQIRENSLLSLFYFRVIIGR